MRIIQASNECWHVELGRQCALRFGVSFVISLASFALDSSGMKVRQIEGTCVIETRYGNPKGRENNQAPGIALDNFDTIRCECRLQDCCQARAIGVAFDRKVIPAARDNDGALTKTI